jgi:hypothetical protein
MPVETFVKEYPPGDTIAARWRRAALALGLRLDWLQTKSGVRWKLAGLSTPPAWR